MSQSVVVEVEGLQVEDRQVVVDHPNGPNNGPQRRGSRLPRPVCELAPPGHGGAPSSGESTPYEWRRRRTPLQDLHWETTWMNQTGQSDEMTLTIPLILAWWDAAEHENQAMEPTGLFNWAERNARALNKHRRTMYNCIEQYAREHLGVRLHLPEGVKPPKLDMKNITPYGGTSSVAEFWTFL